ncbi:PH domain-containing protein [Pyxidicoccus parkwayensis]|uniref:PH domain-containing protein n=1 Tax=Pyxidicoccus parkwayensis TaxID=2813578 RepID=A0ABX7P525_9BACT|nr:PH domain-containing protein [Pyxidicoccus parkwaysis]QSQ25531.1 PH domain-containing protein [Pyxidicoccus parkwaysis]
MADETHVWSGTPSQILNLGAFTLWGLLGLTVVLLPISIGVILWKYLVVKNHKYELTNERLKLEYGVLSKTEDVLELYRVQDTQWEQPFLLRLFGLANIYLVTADPTTPVVAIEAVPNAKALHERIRNLVERRRERKHVHEVQTF